MPSCWGLIASSRRYVRPRVPTSPEQLLASIIELQATIMKQGTLTGKEFAMPVRPGRCALSLDELRRSRDFLRAQADENPPRQAIDVDPNPVIARQ